MQMPSSSSQLIWPLGVFGQSSSVTQVGTQISSSRGLSWQTQPRESGWQASTQSSSVSQGVGSGGPPSGPVGRVEVEVDEVLLLEDVPVVDVDEVGEDDVVPGLLLVVEDVVLVVAAESPLSELLGEQPPAIIQRRRTKPVKVRFMGFLG